MFLWIALGAFGVVLILVAIRMAATPGPRTPAPATVARPEASRPAPAAPRPRREPPPDDPATLPDNPVSFAVAASGKNPSMRPAAPDAARGKGEPEPEEPEDTMMAPRGSMRPAALAKRIHALPPDPMEVDAGNVTAPFALILVTAIGRTDRGRKRTTNEDSYLALPEHHVYAVADGMGGHAAGEVASALAVETMARAFKTKNFGGTPDPKVPRRGDELVRAIESANLAIFEQARANKAQEGMGTTMVATRFSPNKQAVYIAHVGDSRCYRLRDGALAQLTQDHTLGAALGIKGRNADQLIRAVGTERDVGVELTGDEPKPGDFYILCSDGLPKMVSDETVRAIVLANPDLEQACQRLIEAANERGGIDNVTVILIRVDSLVERATRRG